jgi:hypothetical protein
LAADHLDRGQQNHSGDTAASSQWCFQKKVGGGANTRASGLKAVDLSAELVKGTVINAAFLASVSEASMLKYLKKLDPDKYSKLSSATPHFKLSARSWRP